MGFRVLIIEDEPIIVMDLENILHDSGHAVVGSADTMHEGLRLASLMPIDVAIVDIGLTGTADGIEAAKRLRQEHGIASLFVSGRLSERERAMCVEWKPVGFIAKPYQPDEITAALANLAP